MTETTIPGGGARAAFLARESPVVDAIRPYAEGGAEWEPTRDALAALDYAQPARPSADELTGRGDGLADYEPGARALEPGTWDEVVTARHLGILAPEQVEQVLAAKGVTA